MIIHTPPTRGARLDRLASVRRELSKVYREMRAAGPDPVAAAHGKALTYVLSVLGSILKDETVDDLAERVAALERGIK